MLPEMSAPLHFKACSLRLNNSFLVSVPSSPRKILLQVVDVQYFQFGINIFLINGIRVDIRAKLEILYS